MLLAVTRRTREWFYLFVGAAMAFGFGALAVSSARDALAVPHLPDSWVGVWLGGGFALLGLAIVWFGAVALRRGADARDAIAIEASVLPTSVRLSAEVARRVMRVGVITVLSGLLW